ncbi:MAG TPA: hypothetical protein VH092_35895 [Urbifossiella sp.]|jgi:hypothetical protein|nr:hypothetical protein [Urbifossiella sp.]
MTTHRLFLTAVVALVPAVASAQPGFPGFPGMPPPAQSISFEGNEIFRWLLHRADLRPLTDTELFPRQFPPDLSDTVVIVLGRTQFGFAGSHQTSVWVTSALHGGGAVLLADDTHATIGLDRPGGRSESVFTGRHVLSGRPRESFNGAPESPFVEPVARENNAGPVWELFGGDRPLTRVATSTPSTLAVAHDVRKREMIPVIARLPGHCFAVGHGGRHLAAEETAFAAAITERNQFSRLPYRFLAVADPDVFSNGLLVSSDADGPTDNMEFAARAVSFLSEENGQRARTKCLLIVNGQVVKNYEELNRLLRPPTPLPKLPPWDQLQPKLVDLGNQILDKIQENDVLNKMVVGPKPDEPGSWLRRLLSTLLLAVTLWAVVFLVRRVWGARSPTDLAPPPPGGRPPPPPDGFGGVFGRRGKELASRDNLLEPARAACRDLFDTVGGPPEPGPRLPKVVVSDVVRRPETLRQALRDLWAVAYGRPAPVSAARWAVIEPLIPRALAAHRDGKWRFVESEAWGDVSTRPRGEA